MKFQEAKEKLAELAQGEYNALTFKLTVFSNGDEKTQCEVYIHGCGITEGSTWAEAIEKMYYQVKKITPENEELPEVES